MDGPLIEIAGLTKTFGAVTAIQDVSFVAEPGRVTGFLGPNGAGKSTTLRTLLGLVSPTAGEARIGGRPYPDLDRPAALVGAQLETAFHPGRTALDHLRTVAPLVGASDDRCDEVIATVGLTEAARRRVGGFSMGMRQRLGLATALLGDPSALVLDEPANGLDPAGITWMRGFVRAFAAHGGTVLLSSHLLGEVEQTVDDVVIIARGRVRHASSLAELRDLAHPAASLASPDAARLARLADALPGATLTSPHDLTVPQLTPAELGAHAFAAGVEVHRLTETGETLEQVFLRLTEEAA
ncbi:ATP-binding cassette domain-containing protein [Demequina phytophila]|uniref:ATP-binding cassette domain-containing protein n=1 Tax=Demequina phytophila TaxID=1638981 RepID=UPI00078117C5|nr:ATP-binding cassette domain-containing protein [Demequina phytophila]